jgi:hypothetical protein
MDLTENQEYIYPTNRDVEKMAGASTATVSRVFNQTCRVSPGTKAAVEWAIQGHWVQAQSVGSLAWPQQRAEEKDSEQVTVIVIHAEQAQLRINLPVRILDRPAVVRSDYCKMDIANH